MKIKSVTIEGMHNVRKSVTYEMKDFNYLVGANGSGKSTVLQALQLAILGYIPGTAKSNIAIYEHANGPVMKVRVDFDDNTFIERSWASNGKIINAEKNVPNGYDPETVLGDLELPIFNFSEFLGLTANKAKDWFMNFLPGVNSELDWSKQLTDSLEGMNLIDTELISNTVEELSQISGDDTIETIRKCNEALKADLSFSKGELQKLQGTIQSLIYYDDVNCADPDVELSQIKEELNKIREAESTLHSYQSAVDSNARINSLLQTLPELVGELPEQNPKYKELISQKEVRTAELNALMSDSSEPTAPDTSSTSTMISEMQNLIATLSATIKTNEGIIKGKGICPYTSKSCDSIKAMVDKLSEESEDAQKKIAETQIEINALVKEEEAIIQQFTVEQSERNSKRHQLELEISAIEGQLNAMKRDYDTRDSYRSQLVGVPLIDGLKTLEEYQKDKDELIEKSNKIAANKQYNELIETLTADKYKIENTIEAYKVWIKLTGENGLQTTLMEAPFTDFEADMNIFIHESFGNNVDCKFNLSTKANSFSYGISRDHQFIPYNLLSSGEKAMYTFALMRCIVSGYDSSLKLLVVDDVSDHLDKENLKATFESLNNTEDIQIVLAGVNVIEDMPCNLITIG